MKDEIKEIITRLSKYVITPATLDVKDDFNALLDYITNLQEENKHLRTQLNTYKDKKGNEVK